MGCFLLPGGFLFLTSDGDGGLAFLSVGIEKTFFTNNHKFYCLTFYLFLLLLFLFFLLLLVIGYGLTGYMYSKEQRHTKATKALSFICFHSHYSTYSWPSEVQ